MSHRTARTVKLGVAVVVTGISLTVMRSSVQAEWRARTRLPAFRVMCCVAVLADCLQTAGRRAPKPVRSVGTAGYGRRSRRGRQEAG